MSTSKAEKNSSTEVTYSRPRCEYTDFHSAFGGGGDDDGEQDAASDDDREDAWDDGGDFGAADGWDGDGAEAEWDEEEEACDPADMVPADKHILVIFDINGIFIFRTGSDKKGFKLRPHVEEVFAALERQSHCIIPAVWSSMASWNVERMVNLVFREKVKRLAFVWDQKWCTQKCMAGLGKPLLRKDLVNLKHSKYGNFNPDRVLLVDDDAHKCTANASGTAIHPKSFTGQAGDRELIGLAAYLEKLGRSGCQSVRQFVLRNPYGEPPSKGPESSRAALRRPLQDLADKEREEAEQAAKKARMASTTVVPAAPRTPPAMRKTTQPNNDWKRMESRSQPGVFYYYHQESGETRLEPPPPWEQKESRSKPGTFYYWNPVTSQTSIEKPDL